MKWKQSVTVRLCFILSLGLSVTQVVDSISADNLWECKSSELSTAKKRALRQVCDGYKSCPLGDDEDSCTACPLLSYQCPSDLKCIPGRMVCDLHADCSDGMDEEKERSEWCKNGYLRSLYDEATQVTGGLTCPEDLKLSVNRMNQECNGFVACTDTLIDEADCATLCVSSADVSPAALTEISANIDNPLKCNQRCKKGGYKYALLQGDKCSCAGNTLTISTVAEKSLCNTPCSGNGYFSCGGGEQYYTVTDVSTGPVVLTETDFTLPPQQENILTLEGTVFTISLPVTSAAECTLDSEFLYTVLMSVDGTLIYNDKSGASYNPTYDSATQLCQVDIDYQFPAEGSFLVQFDLNTALAKSNVSVTRHVSSYNFLTQPTIECSEFGVVGSNLHCEVLLSGGSGWQYTYVYSHTSADNTVEQLSRQEGDATEMNLKHELGNCEMSPATLSEIVTDAGDLIVDLNTRFSSSVAGQVYAVSASLASLDDKDHIDLPKSLLSVFVVTPQCGSVDKPHFCSDYRCHSSEACADADSTLPTFVKRSKLACEGGSECMVDYVPYNPPCNIYKLQNAAVGEANMFEGDFLAFAVSQSHAVTTNQATPMNEHPHAYKAVWAGSSATVTESITDHQFHFKAVVYTNYMQTVDSPLLGSTGSVTLTSTFTYPLLGAEDELKNMVISKTVPVILSARDISVMAEGLTLNEDGTYTIGPVTTLITISASGTNLQFAWNIPTEIEAGANVLSIEDATEHFQTSTTLNFDILGELNEKKSVVVSVDISNAAGTEHFQFTVNIDPCHLATVQSRVTHKATGLYVPEQLDSAVNVRRNQEIQFLAALSQQCEEFRVKNYYWSLVFEDGQTRPLGDPSADSIAFPSLALGYGLWTVSLTQTVEKGEQVITDKTTSFFNVIISDCQPTISKISSTIPLDMLPRDIDGTSSLDPDDPTSTTSCKACQFVCTSTDHSGVSLDTDLTIEQNLAKFDGYGTCFGSTEYLFDESDCVLTIPADGVQQNDAFHISLYLKEGQERQLVSSDVKIMITEVGTPSFTINPSVHLPDKLDADDKYSWSMVCPNCLTSSTWTVTGYQWTIYKMQVDKGTGERQDVSNSFNMLRNSITITFAAGSFELGEDYILSGSITNSLGLTATQEEYISINSPPLVVGHCTISPASGIVLKTKFSISCQNVFTDEDVPLVYQAFIGDRILSNEKVNPEFSNMTLSSGDPENNNILLVTIRASDKWGASASDSVSVQVTLSGADASDVQCPEGADINDASMLANAAGDITASGNGTADNQEATDRVLACLAQQNTATSDDGALLGDAYGRAATNPDNVKGDSAKNLASDIKNKLGKLKLPSSFKKAKAMAKSASRATAATAKAISRAKNRKNAVHASEAADTSTNNDLEAESSMSNLRETSSSLLVGSIAQTPPCEKNEFETDTMSMIIENYCDEALTDTGVTFSNLRVPFLPPKCFEPNKRCMSAIITYKNSETQPYAGETPQSELSDIKLVAIDLAAPATEPEILSVAFTETSEAVSFLVRIQNPQFFNWSSINVTKEQTPIQGEVDVPGSSLFLDLIFPYDDDIPEELTVLLAYNKNFTIDEDPSLYDYQFEGIDLYRPENIDSDLSTFVAAGYRRVINDCVWDYYSEEESSDNTPVCLRFFIPGFEVADRNGTWLIVLQGSKGKETEAGFKLYSIAAQYYKEDTATWDADGCWVAGMSTAAELWVNSMHLSSFGGSFFIAPNSLDVMSSIKMLANLNDNPVVFATLVCVFGIYLIVAVWCRRKDKLDSQKLGITVLPDNNPNYTYEYEITIYTGLGGDCGTTANVTMQMTGEKGVSEPHVMFAPGKSLFKCASVDTFILTTSASLGELKSVSIWHNQKGSSPSWYLKHVVVKDLPKAGKQYIFLNNRWLAVEKDDGQIEREIPVAGEEDLKDFSTLFRSKIERDLWDGHIWFSVFGRPVRSTFSRLQRCSCCLCLLLCTMLANIMFFGQAEKDTNQIDIAGVKLSWTQFMVGIECNIVIFPVNFLLAYLFKKARPREPKKASSSKNDEQPLATRPKKRRPMGAATQSSATLGSHSLTSLNSPSMGNLTVSYASMNMAESCPPKKQKEGFVAQLMSKFKKSEKPPPKSYANHGAMLGGASTHSIDSVINEPPPSELPANKKSKGLPWWVTIFAWILLVFTCFVAAFFTLLYGMSYGKSTSLLWLQTFVIGFFQSLIFVQPVKIMLLGLFFALIIKKPEVPDNKESEHMQKITDVGEPGPTYMELGYSDYKKEYMRLQASYNRPSKVDVEAARIYREKQKKMWAALFEVGRYLVFLFLLSTICNGQMDPMAYNMTNNIRNMFTEGTTFPKIMRYTDVWKWMETYMYPKLYNEAWYNGEMPKNIRGFADDKQSYIVGSARVRQVRLHENDTCKLEKDVQSVINNCHGEYGMGSGDITGYLEGWVLPPTPIDSYTYWTDGEGSPGMIVGSNPWVYVPQLQADGIPIWGDHNVYGPGGYMFVVPPDEDDFKQLFDSLVENGWLNHLTRAVLVEFTMFNPNVNLFSVVTLLVEFSAQGDGYPFSQMKTLRLYPYLSGVGYLVLVCQLVYLMFVIYFMVQEIKQLKKEKLKYFKQFWNWVELTIIALSWAAFGLMISYLVAVKVTMSQIEEMSETGTRFISFGGPAAVNESYRICSAGACFFAYLKLLHMLRFNKKITSFAAVIKYCSKDLFNFFIMFGLFFFAFAQFAYLVLGPVVHSYKSLVTTSTTLMAMMLGQWDFEEVERANRFLGPGFLFAFVISSNLVLINVFLSIICEACDTVKGDFSKMENDFEVVDFMVGQLKMFVGSSKIAQMASKRMEKTGNASDSDESEDEGRMRGDGEQIVKKKKKKTKPVNLDDVMVEFDSQMNFIQGHYCGESDDDEEEFDGMWQGSLNNEHNREHEM